VLHATKEVPRECLKFFEKLSLGGISTSSFINWDFDIVPFPSQACLEVMLATEGRVVDEEHEDDENQGEGEGQSAFSQKCRHLAIPNDSIHYFTDDFINAFKFPVLESSFLIKNESKHSHTATGNLQLTKVPGGIPFRTGFTILRHRELSVFSRVWTSLKRS
jgi:hypothetical protein